MRKNKANEKKDHSNNHDKNVKDLSNKMSSSNNAQKSHRSSTDKDENPCSDDNGKITSNRSSPPPSSFPKQSPLEIGKIKGTSLDRKEKENPRRKRRRKMSRCFSTAISYPSRSSYS